MQIIKSPHLDGVRALCVSAVIVLFSLAVGCQSGTAAKTHDGNTQRWQNYQTSSTAQVKQGDAAYQRRQAQLEARKHAGSVPPSASSGSATDSPNKQP